MNSLATSNTSPVSDIADRVTVLILTSPIPSHPDTSIIYQTIESVASRIPDVPIFILCDGVREEQEEYRASYDQYQERLADSVCAQWPNVSVVIHPHHLHQAAMTRKTIKSLRSMEQLNDYILFMEHDTPLTGTIPFDLCLQVLDETEFDLIRFYHETVMQPEHRHLMLDDSPINWGMVDLPLTRTAQWSQRPHLARSSRYITWLDHYFSANCRTMIEDRMHGVVHENFLLHGLDGWWSNFRLLLYTPDGNIQRSTHTDGRGGDNKYDHTYTF